MKPPKAEKENMKEIILHLNKKLVMIRGENVLGDNPKRYYVHVDGTMFPKVFATYHAARLFAGKMAKTFRSTWKGHAGVK